jgi:hypothetical protein
LARFVPGASESVGVVPHIRNYPNTGSTLQIQSSALEVAYDFAAPLSKKPRNTLASSGWEMRCGIDFS